MIPCSGQEPVISIAEARRTMSSVLGGTAASMDVCEPEQAQPEQHAQHAQQVQHAQHAAPLMRTVSAAELRSMAERGAMRLASGAHVRDVLLRKLCVHHAARRAELSLNFVACTAASLLLSCTGW